MTTKDFAIGVLSVTATILLVGLVILNVMEPRPAYAVGQSGSGGDYLICTSQLDESTEIVYILDAGVGRMNVYGFDINAGRTELIQSMDVQVRERPQGAGAERPRR